MKKSNLLVIFCCVSFVVLCVSNGSATLVTINYNSVEGQDITGSTTTNHWYDPSNKPYGHWYREYWSYSPIITWVTTPDSIAYDDAMYDLSFSVQNISRIETFVYRSCNTYNWKGTAFGGYHYYAGTSNSTTTYNLNGISRIPQLTLIPEPATLLLFGLGGLALRRCKK